ncbi:MAG: Y-family DNA polymerase [Myxococcaceae bacterium]
MAYLHVPRFPVQRRLALLAEAASRPDGRATAPRPEPPLALVQQVRGVQRVQCLSASASTAGVRTGMSLAAARALVPSLRDMPYQAAEEASALGAVAEGLLALAPASMSSVPDGFWLDASAASLFGGEQPLLERALGLLLTLGLRGRGAVASELFTARALARFGSARLCVVPRGASAQALAPLPLQALEGVDAPVRDALCTFGLSTLGGVASLAPAQVVTRLGARGLRAQRLARGEDETRLLPALVPEVVEELCVLEAPAEAFEPLLFVLKGMVEVLCARLRGRGKAAVRLTLTLLLEPDGPRPVPLVLARPSAEPKLLLDLLRHRLEDLRLPAPVATVVLSVDESCEDRGQQRVLGAMPEGDTGLESVLARLVTALGPQALSSPRAAEDHRPEAARALVAFHPPPLEHGLHAELRRAPATPPPLEARSAERPVRLFPVPAPLPVELGPAGELQGARLLGRRRAVLGLAGPERLGGQWWTPAPFARDYYRVHFEGLGPAWVFKDGRDGRFYLHGFFD